VLPPMVIALWRLALGKGFEGLPIHIEYSQEIANPLMRSTTFKSIARPPVTRHAGIPVHKSPWMITG
jgi:hypothetical protein